ncbi:MAG: hypothetical protein ACYCZ2_16115, partial [Lutibacter sp.]
MVVITSVDYGHIRQHFHQANIFQNLMCRTVFTQSQT